MPPNLPTSGPVLGIIAGGGRLPEVLADQCQASGRDYFVAVIEGQGAPNAFDPARCQEFRLGAVGKLIKTLRKQGVEELVFAGSVTRPSLKTLMPDWWTAAFLARTKAFNKGDDGLLRAIVTSLETDEGFSIIGPDEIVPELLSPTGVLGRIAVPEELLDLVEAGVAAARDLGARDVGQAVIICRDGRVIEEDQTGTDAMLGRAGIASQGGILVKVMKPGQERRVDLPAVGPETIDQASRAKLAGIVVEAGHSIILDRSVVTDKSNSAGLFVFGYGQGAAARS